MELTDVMRTAVSTRRHLPDPVPDEIIYRLLDNARFAPSGGNRQGWRVIVVTDEKTRHQLAALYRKSWYEFHAPLYRQTGPDYFADHIHLVPVHLVVLVAEAAITTTNAALDGGRIVGGAGVYPFVQNLVLAIRNEGLGTTLTTVLVPVEDEARALLRIPDGYRIAAHLAVGKRAGAFPAQLRRKPVEDFATVDSFDGTPFRLPPQA